MRFFSTLLLGVGSVLSVCSASYLPAWESLDTRPMPSWYDDAKFGIFIHWGVYSVPAWAPVGAYAEWYWSELSNPNSATSAFHNKTYGSDFRYADFARDFKAELFDPDEWADLFKKSGAQYVVPTSKHHEGYTLWRSPSSWNWNAVDTGPHRDLLYDLAQSIKKQDLKLGFYYSLFEWFHPLYKGSHPSEYVDQVMIPQMTELINRYQPDLLWGDGEWDHDSSFWKTPQFFAWVFNESPVKDSIVINDRWGNDTRGRHGGFYTAEYDPTVHLGHKWEENSGIDLHSFGLNRMTPASDYYTSEDLVKLLIRSVSNNGNLLLDIGPRSDGTIPPIMQERLLEIGEWLQMNGESIYGSRMWRVAQEGPIIDDTNVRYTRSNKHGGFGESIYAHVLRWPDQNVLTLLAPIVGWDTKITLLGDNIELKFLPREGGGVFIEFPNLSPSTAKSKYVWVLRIDNAI